jgi:hypothetical protein
MKNRTNVFFDDQDLERLKALPAKTNKVLPGCLEKSSAGS